MLPKALSTDSILPWENGLVVNPAAEGLPGLSIIIPIYNSGRFLEKTLRSLLCNDLTGVELIVMDGGSTDNTHEILQHYSAHLSRIVSEKDEGQSDAINKGFALASHDLLYWLNGDDILLPNTLNTVREYFKANPSAQVVVGDAYMTELDFRPIRHFKFSPEAIKFDVLIDYAKNHLVQPSVFFSRTAWNAAGPLKKELHYAMDADLFLGMASRFEMHHLPLDIAYSVYHEECKTRGRRAESITELALVQAAHGGHGEARKTLDILVHLFNELASSAGAQAQAAGNVVQSCERCEITARKLHALHEEVEANKELALKADLVLCNG